MILASADASPVILAANRAFEEIFGVGREPARGQRLLRFLAPDDREAFDVALEGLIDRGGRGFTTLATLDAGGEEGRLMEWEVAVVAGDDGRPESLVAILGDPRITTVAGSPLRRGGPGPADPLAGERNLVLRLERAVDRARDVPAYGFAVVGLEIEDLSALRKRYGRTASDELVRAYAWRVRKHLRPDDLVARIDESLLAVFLEGCVGPGGVRRVVRRLQEKVSPPFGLECDDVCLRPPRSTGLAYSGECAPECVDDVLRSLRRGAAGHAD